MCGVTPNTIAMIRCLATAVAATRLGNTDGRTEQASKRPAHPQPATRRAPRRLDAARLDASAHRSAEAESTAPPRIRTRTKPTEQTKYERPPERAPARPPARPHPPARSTYRAAPLGRASRPESTPTDKLCKAPRSFVRPSGGLVEDARQAGPTGGLQGRSCNAAAAAAAAAIHERTPARPPARQLAGPRCNKGGAPALAIPRRGGRVRHRRAVRRGEASGAARRASSARGAPATSSGQLGAHCTRAERVRACVQAEPARALRPRAAPGVRNAKSGDCEAAPSTSDGVAMSAPLKGGGGEGRGLLRPSCFSATRSQERDADWGAGGSDGRRRAAAIV
ncbi:hypothetical protein HETIRDRAFT_461461 [Heterobasidion irregulare TC 32-1]|uniref:Uncharacterized protein n=1 Tax=Heterobasidion irregulare (strain TC 32-1) TaxID=747525 RepID=W4JMN0_HETIT|nr:uncharacterized protein HETIRDRAFT_461461 [Heterobasidion irregulare TC 32-1]ETW74802.1 hypothetical protein HETIRDRAFT_461461 [Heterobasidion irregulare TC 32-1]